MSQIPKRSELNASLYKEVNSINNDEFHRDFLEVSKKNKNYYNSILQIINENLKTPNLYASQSLNEDEKNVQMQHQIKEWLNSLGEIIQEASIKEESMIERTNWLKDNQNILNDLNAKVQDLASIREMENNMEKELFKNTNKTSIINYRTRLRKELQDPKNNDEFKQLINGKKNLSIKTMTNAKRALNKYKTKWVWYLVPMIILIIGAVLCIVIPLYV